MSGPYSQDIAAAFQFLTCLPLTRLAYEPDALSRAAKFFPLVGLAVGVAAAGIYSWLSPHFPRCRRAPDRGFLRACYWRAA